MKILPFFPNEESFRYTINLSGEDFGFRFRWMNRISWWYMDLYTADDVPILLNRRLCLGIALNARSNFIIGPNGVLVLADMTGAGEPIDRYAMGADVKLVMLEADDLASDSSESGGLEIEV